MADISAPTVVPVTTTQDDITEEFPHIQKLQNVLIQMPSGNIKMVNLKPNTQVTLGKFGTFQANNLIDQPFGVSYEIYDDKGSIRPVRNFSLSIVEETTANNQTIVDDTSVQKLTHEEVEKLKEEGLKGNMDAEEIIKKMVASHAEFDKKTEFSKAKYILRKKKKFMKVFTPIRPTMYNIAQYFFNKNPDKIKNLRIDTLSQLLGLANVRSNGKLLVVDDTQGLIVAAAAERMGGYGTIVGLHEGLNHNYDILRYMNFSKHVLSTIHTVPLSKVDPQVPDDPWEELTEEEFNSKSIDEQKGYMRRKKMHETKTKSRQLLLEGGFDGLIVSSPYTPKSVIENLLKYVLGSRPIVVYSFSKEVLLEAAAWMRKSPDFLNADITESSLRQYQVLPGRTHPEMTMSAGGGYLLSALRVIDCPFDFSLVNKDDTGGRRNKKPRNDAKDAGNKNASETPKQDTSDKIEQ